MRAMRRGLLTLVKVGYGDVERFAVGDIATLQGRAKRDIAPGTQLKPPLFRAVEN